MEKSSETRELILNSATKLFAAKGYDGVGVQEICNESQITKPTLYYYFGSKTGLLSAIIEEKGSAFLKALQSASNYTGDFVGSLTKILESTIDFAKANPDFYRLHCTLKAASGDSEAWKLYEPFYAKIQNLMTDFFLNSSNEIGNMRGKEILFSRIFLQTSQAVALDIIQDRLEKNNSMSFSVIHSFVYGVAAG
ncbi:MAG: TetR/AcrR family transcriptional regulator [Spirochaetaceae bacterium]|nr:TetR/AcrR family transcriptional regulator [Spirochaetaceae bacterium]